MFDVKAGISINQPVEKVFAFIAENENDPLWCVPVVETTRISGDEPRKGARYSFVSKAGFMKLGGEFEITKFEPPLMIGWKGTSPLGSYVGHYQLEKKEDGSSYLEEFVTFTYRGIWRLMEGMHQRQFTSSYELQLNRLKQLLEEMEIKA